jgi:enoyl-CoA hydratase/carnithine racemase
VTGIIAVLRDGPIATVVLNRPEKLNALTLDMWQALGEAIDALRRRRDSLRDRARRRRESVFSRQRHR